MGSIEKFVYWMRLACTVWSLGYDQSNRWDIRDGGECDCSSLVIWALRKAGFDVGSASYTGDLSDNLVARGWRRIRFTALAQLRTGDILLNDEFHVCAVISGSGAGAIVAQASIDENGRATGGASGDQSGRETNTRTAYVYSRGWDCVLRWEGGDSDATAHVALDVTGTIDEATVTMWQEAVGTVPDGVVSGQAAEHKAIMPALASATWDGTGSQLMLRVQAIVGVPDPVGVAGPHTIALLQATLVRWGYDMAGAQVAVLDAPTAKALQRSLNDGRWSA